MALGPRRKVGARIFESELFRKHIYCVSERVCDIVGIFGDPHSDLEPPSDLVLGELCPLTCVPVHILCPVFALRYLMLL